MAEGIEGSVGVEGNVVSPMEDLFSRREAGREKERTKVRQGRKINVIRVEKNEHVPLCTYVAPLEALPHEIL